MHSKGEVLAFNMPNPACQARGGSIKDGNFKDKNCGFHYDVNAARGFRRSLWAERATASLILEKTANAF